MILSENDIDVKCFNHCGNIISEIESFKPDVILLDFLDSTIWRWRGVHDAEKHVLAQKDISHTILNSPTETIASIAGANYFLKNPFTKQQLIDIVNKALNK